MVTPVNADHLEELLNKYRYDRKETEFLIDGFKNGFDIGYRGPIKGIRRLSPNLKIRIGSELELWNKVMKEVRAKRYAGPYAEPPFENFIQSPIGLVPKDGGKSTRLIFHLSYPRNGSSINSETPADWCSVKYPDFSEAIKLCMNQTSSEESFAVIGKSDMTSAFRQLGLRKDQFCLLLLKARSPFDGKVYFFVEKSLPFGAAISCSHFQRFSMAVAFITEKRSGKPVINYLDDYLFAAMIKSLCDRQMHIFLDVCEYICFPVSMEKTYWGTTMLVFLGILINTVGRYVAIPADKISKALDLVESLLGARKTTVKTIQRLCGYLNFLCKCVVPGRAFLRRLYSCYPQSLLPHHHFRVDKDMKADLAMWRAFLLEPTVFCRPFMDFQNVLCAEDLDWYTDASGVVGVGGVHFSNFFLARWDREFLRICNPSIAYKELMAVIISVLNWAKLHQNKRICLFVDNDSVKNMINSSTTKCKNCMVLIRVIVLECMRWNVRIFAKYVETKKNFFADSLSRFQITRFKQLSAKYHRQFDIHPTPIPELIWPPSKIWIH